MEKTYEINMYIKEAGSSVKHKVTISTTANNETEARIRISSLIHKHVPESANLREKEIS